MVAYSFKRQFIDPIRVGLGLPDVLRRLSSPPPPKRQTIRADRARHARPGEELQLYHGMRTKHCFLIGRAICTDVQPIRITFRRSRIKIATQIIEAPLWLNEFAQADGFDHWMAMRDFWAENHAGTVFKGVIIYWRAPSP